MFQGNTVPSSSRAQWSMAPCSFKMFGTTHPTAQCCIPEDMHPQKPLCENLIY